MYLARLAVVERHRPLVGIEPSSCVGGKDGDRLQAVHRLITLAVDGHQREHAVCARRPDHRPQWQVDFAPRQGDERPLHGLEAADRVEQFLDVRFAEDQDLAQVWDSRIG